MLLSLVCNVIMADAIDHGSSSRRAGEVVPSVVASSAGRLLAFVAALVASALAALSAGADRRGRVAPALRRRHWMSGSGEAIRIHAEWLARPASFSVFSSNACIIVVGTLNRSLRHAQYIDVSRILHQSVTGVSGLDRRHGFSSLSHSPFIVHSRVTAREAVPYRTDPRHKSRTPRRGRDGRQWPISVQPGVAGACN